MRALSRMQAGDLLLKCLHGDLDCRVLVVGPKGSPLDDPIPLFFGHKFFGHKGVVTVLDKKPISHRGIFCVCHGDILNYQRELKKFVEERHISIGIIGLVIGDVVDSNPFPDNIFKLIVDHVTLRFIVGFMHDSCYGPFDLRKAVADVVAQYNRTLEVGGCLAFFLDRSHISRKILFILRSLLKGNYSFEEIIDFDDFYSIKQQAAPTPIITSFLHTSILGSSWREKRHFTRFSHNEDGYSVCWDPQNYKVNRLLIARKKR